VFHVATCCHELQRQFKFNTIKSSVSWDATPCSPLKANRRFGRTCLLHLEDRGTSRATYHSESNGKLIFNAGILLGFFLDPEDGGNIFL
jgi:hypothetical protein